MVVSMASVGALALGRPPQGVLTGEPKAGLVRAGDASAPVVFEGFVLGPDGAPLEGAVVSTSVGGRAVADPGGRFRLEIEVPLDATSVQVRATVARDHDLVARTNVSLSAGARNAAVGPLTLVAELVRTCVPGWIPTFGAHPGTDERVLALTVFDDGSGPALYAAGRFVVAGSLPSRGIARWDGSSWSALGSGMDYSVHALGVFDAGSGPVLYAGGQFTTAGGGAASQIAQWDGSTWAAVGGDPLESDSDSRVLAFSVFDDGGGPAPIARDRVHAALGELLPARPDPRDLHGHGFLGEPVDLLLPRHRRARRSTAPMRPAPARRPYATA
jgi:hypothetical protein